MAVKIVKCSIVNNYLEIDPDSLKVNTGDEVKFETSDTEPTYEVVIQNTDGFFSGSTSPWIREVTSTSSATTNTVAAQKGAVKYYSVGVINYNPPPIPPFAPPRIIVVV